MENIYESVHELSCLAEFKSTSVESTVSPEKPQAQLLVLHCGSIKPVLDGDNDHVIITVHVTNEEYSLQTEFPQLPKPGQS